MPSDWKSVPGRPTSNLNEALSDIKSGAGLVPRDSTPIELAWKRLEEESQTTSDLVNKLYSRLQPILTPEGGAQTGTPSAPTPTVSPLVDAIHNLGSRTASSNEALRRLIDRLEL